jgi:uncharacterized protein YndB with AHSA1/START domain
MTSNAQSHVEGTFATIDGRPALRFERRLPHPVEAVWSAVTNPDELASWFPAAVTVDLRQGGAMTFVFPDEGLPPGNGVVKEYDPPHHFAFDWDGTLLQFELEPQDGGAACLLRFTHFLQDRDAAARDLAGWHVCLDRMEQHLAGDSATAPTSEPTGEWRALYEKYVDRGVPHGAAIPGESLG